MKHFTRRFLLMAALLIAGAVVNFGGGVAFATDTWSYPTSKPTGIFSGGDGSKSSPYIIRYAQDLADLAYMVNQGENYKGKYFKLERNLNLNDNPSVHSSSQCWIPIGCNDNVFKGNFDGAGHTISGISIDKSAVYSKLGITKGNMGLFGKVQDGQIRNLTIENCSHYYSSKALFETIYAGFVAGEADDEVFSNVHVKTGDATVGTTYFGGMVGYSSDCVYNNVSFDGNIDVVLDADNLLNTFYLGGIIGYGEDESLCRVTTSGIIHLGKGMAEDSFNYKSLFYYVGGVIGVAYGDIDVMTDVTNHIDIHMDASADGKCHLSPFFAGIIGCTKEDVTMNRVANLGDIYIGEDDGRIFCTSLHLHCSGLANCQPSDFLTNEVTLTDCVNYGNFHIKGNLQSRNNIATGLVCLTNAFGGNKIKIDMKRSLSVQTQTELTTTGDNIPYYNLAVGAYPSLKTTPTQTYDNVFFMTNLPEKHSNNLVKYYNSKSTEEMKALIETFNTAAGSKVWGKYATTDDGYNGLPLPIGCGGTISDMAGTGSADNPYLISSEQDLRDLQKAVAEGQTTDGTYFSLASDIDMSNTPFEAIGTAVYPFGGIFDGKGHSINGAVLKDGHLFKYLYGTVQNLTMLGVTVSNYDYAFIAPIALNVGGSANSDTKAGYIYNCYVNADLYGYRSSIEAVTDINMFGICGILRASSTVKNCYFKGTIHASSKTVDGETVRSNGIPSSTASTYLYSAGLAKTLESGCYLQDCYASFSMEKNGDFTHKYDKAILSNSNENSGTLQSCYYVCSEYENQQLGTEKYESESELNTKLTSSDWLAGYYRPVIKGTKYYAAKTPDGTTTYLDAIPEAQPKSNDILNINLTDKLNSDACIWSLPNVAIYDSEKKIEWIPNGVLDQNSNFRYNPNTEATTTMGTLHYDLTQSEKGYHLVCLPGTVEKDDLPAGTKVMVVRGITNNDDDANRQVNVVMVDEIPAGVPCFIHIPDVAEGTKVSLLMIGSILAQPNTDSFGSLKGTFSKANVTNACTSATYKDGEPFFIHTSGEQETKPFTAWLEGAEGNVKILDYLLLDENNENMTALLYSMNGMSTGVKLLRTFSSTNWNTLCLPFDMTENEVQAAFGTDAVLEQFSSISHDDSDDSYTLHFSKAGAIEAGKPYLIKTTAGKDCYDMTTDKQVLCSSESFVPKGESNSVGDKTLTMQGEYNKRNIGFDDIANKDIYIISGNKIYYVNSEVEMKGFRCYFVAEESTTGSTGGSSSALGSSMLSNARMLHSDGSSTDLRLIKADATGDTDAVYDLLGRKGNAQTKGVVIENKMKKIKH